MTGPRSAAFGPEGGPTKRDTLVPSAFAPLFPLRPRPCVVAHYGSHLQSHDDWTSQRGNHDQGPYSDIHWDLRWSDLLAMTSIVALCLGACGSARRPRDTALPGAATAATPARRRPQLAESDQSCQGEPASHDRMVADGVSAGGGHGALVGW
jgi:hypothetical protein